MTQEKLNKALELHDAIWHIESESERTIKAGIDVRGIPFKYKDHPAVIEKIGELRSLVTSLVESELASLKKELEEL